MEPRRKLILYIIVSFMLGAAGGVFVGTKIAPSREWPGRRDGSSPMKEFAQRLKLDERQTVMVDSILESHRAAFDSIRKSYGNAFRMERDTIRTQIEALLDDEQKKLYGEYLEEMEQHESRRRSGGSPPDRRDR